MLIVSGEVIANNDFFELAGVEVAALGKVPEVGQELEGIVGFQTGFAQRFVGVGFGEYFEVVRNGLRHIGIGAEVDAFFIGACSCGGNARFIGVV